MSDNGFCRYTGQLESRDVLVEDYVDDDLNTNTNQLGYCGVNRLLCEIRGFNTTATLLATAPPVSILVLVSTPSRHLVFFRTQTPV